MSEGKKAAKSWPIGIAVVYGGFVLFFITLLFLTAMDQDDLVTENYYAAEQGYQEHIYRVQRARALKEKPRLTYDRNKQLLILAFPEEFPAEKVSGTLTFYRPNEADLDRTYPIELDEQRQQLIEAAPLAKGLWEVKILWKARGLEYFIKEIITIQ